MILFTFPEQKLLEFGCTVKPEAGYEDWVRSFTGGGQLAGGELQCGVPPGGGGGELETRRGAWPQPAAGHHRPRLITTAAQLSSLMEGSARPAGGRQ